MTAVLFATPIAFVLLVLVAVPLLLWRRQPPGQRRRIAGLYLWRDVRKPLDGAIARRRRRVTVLTALQMLAIAMTVLALTRPALVMSAARVTLVFDISASMAAQDGRDTRLAAARSAARGVVNRLSPASRVHVIAAAAGPRDLGEYPAADPSLGRLIDGISATAGDADLRAAVAMARAASVSQVTVFSDQPPLDGLADGDDGRPIRWERVGHAVDNVAISLVSARRTALGSDAGTVIVEVRNFGAQPVDPAIEVATDGQPVVMRTLPVPARGSATTSAAVLRLGRVVSARLLMADGLAVDNIRYAPVPESEPLAVTFIGPRGSFVERALAVNPLVSLRALDGRSISAAALAGADVVVCDGCSTPPAAARSTLLLSPPQGKELPRLLTVADPGHPIAVALDVIGQTAVATDRSGGDAGDIVLRAGDQPVLIAHDDDLQRVINWRIDLARGGFALSPVFPVLIANAIQWLARSDTERIDVRAGEPLQLAFRTSATSDRPIVTGPDGRPRDAVRLGSDVVVADTAVPGMYTIRVGDRVRVGIVNPSVASESDLAAVADPSRPDPAERLSPGTEPVSLAPLFAMLAAVLIAGEWHLRARGVA